ncbi:MAG TPA: macrolide ABC transporter ATP-binding protein [Syntrophorhabdus aromaticivorans]|nr:macrolide ABC transporter ATP-binding protein [Syntrophorhabdus aromaticivorans]
MSNKVLMKLKGITRTYLMGEVTVDALKETSLDIYEGELLVILGPSGSGKSTLLNIMGGMDLPSTGEVFFDGENLSRAAEGQLTAYRRREVGFVFQFYNLIPDLTAGENVELAAGLVEDPLSVTEMLKEVGLATRIDHFPSQLSGGEQQRVAIARAIVKEPALILADEPTGNLDTATGNQVLDLLEKRCREHSMSLLMVTHTPLTCRYAHRILRMVDGVITEQTSCSETEQ